MHIRPEEGPFAKRMRELAKRADVAGHKVWTDFLTPREAQLAAVAARKEGVGWAADGGHPTAERVRGCFFQGEDEPNPEAVPVWCVRATLPQGAARLTHRDYLGAALGLGLDRSRIGDIVTDEHGAFVFCTEEASRLLLAEWVQAGRERVFAALVETGGLQGMAPPALEEYSATLLSLRLDACVAHAFKLSRTGAAERIRSGDVQLNFVRCTDLAAEICPCDTISLKGVGRARILAVEGKSRSGRTFVRYARYR